MDKINREYDMEHIYKNVISAYNTIAKAYDGAYAENDDIDRKYLDEFIKKIEGGAILDMGCGTGGNTAYLIKKGINAIGIDASEGMVEVAKKAYPFLDIKRGNILNAPFEDKTFAGIVLAYVINHFNNIGLQMLKQEIDRLLRDDGFVFISAHVGDGEKMEKDPLDENINIYYNFLSVDTLDELFFDYKREFFESRKSFGEEEFLCDKIFVIYKKVKR